MDKNKTNLRYGEYRFATCIHNVKGGMCGVDGYPVIDCPNCTSYKKIDTTELDTFPDDDKDYCKLFEVPTDWLLDVIRAMDSYNERKDVTVQQFCEEYVWEETEVIYDLAKCQGKLLREAVQK